MTQSDYSDRPRKRHVYPKEVRQYAVALHKAGLGAKRIGKTLGMDSSVVKGWLRRYKLYGEESLQPWWREKPQPRKAVSDEPLGTPALYERYKEVLQLYAQSRLSRSEACRRCGVDYGSFTYYLRRYCPQYIRPKVRGLNPYQMELKQATRKKYRNAIKLYAATNLPLKQICEQEGVCINGFKKYVSVYRRDLLLKRHEFQISRREADKIRLRSGGVGPTLAGRRKYKEAIEACDDIKHIEYNVSEIAREFHLDCSGLSAQLRYHYPEIKQARELERRRRGIDDNQHRGPRPWCVEQYAAAIEVLRTTDKTIRQVADECNVPFHGLRAHLAQYHKDIVALRAGRRKAAKRNKRQGELNSTGDITKPSVAKMAQFREAVELYRTTLLPLKEIAKQTNVSLNGLTYHLYRWHRNLVLKRKGIRPDGTNEYMDLSRTKHYLKSTKMKYAEAIARLKKGAGSVAAVAAEFGFNPETFRGYISTHEPRLARKYGSTKLKNGKSVLARSKKKYAEAIRIYQTTAEPLKSIAKRLGLVYNSLGGFIRRNCPEIIERHNALVEKMNMSDSGFPLLPHADAGSVCDEV